MGYIKICNKGILQRFRKLRPQGLDFIGRDLRVCGTALPHGSLQLKRPRIGFFIPQ